MSGTSGLSAESDPGPVSAIVLAGGRSSRFGADKLAVSLDGVRLLDRAIRAVAAAAVEVVVVVAPGDERRPTIDPGTVRLVADPEAFGGPLVGLLAGLEMVAQPIALVVGGDMPDLQPAVLRLLVGRLIADAGVDAVVLRSRGALVPLPAAVRTGAATDHARRLIGDGERRLRSLFERLPTRVLEEGDWRGLDPDGNTVRDIDVPADLDG